MNNKLKIVPLENTQLSHKTRRALIDIIRQNAGEGKPFKLPNEDELSQQLGVSRNVLRDALMALEQMGIVTRRRSKGTIANPKIANFCGRIDIEPELTQTLKEVGYKVRVDTQRLGFVFEPEPFFGKDQECYLNVEKAFYADDKPAAFCSDHIVGSYAKNAKDSIYRLKELSHYEFLKRYCDTAMAYTTANLDVIVPEPWLVQLLKTEDHEPVLMMEDLAYNYDHEIVVHSVIYFKRGLVNIKFLRKVW